MEITFMLALIIDSAYDYTLHIAYVNTQNTLNMVFCGF